MAMRVNTDGKNWAVSVAPRHSDDAKFFQLLGEHGSSSRIFNRRLELYFGVDGGRYSRGWAEDYVADLKKLGYDAIVVEAAGR